ncbi:hypothetical protein IWQ62_000103 [Dispira parvispora]|uniref:Carrier domain-containing protein n=1 Tax=Dispira parvispora TaxID=1520584 RepID=A0A9W8B0S8_9FUNG|nr:hypothetical protein IWQ62_000103 [Dispira parvispora]
MCPAVDTLGDNPKALKANHSHGATLGIHACHSVSFQLTNPLTGSLWSVIWALMLNHGGGKEVQADSRIGFGWLEKVEGDWAVKPMVVNIAPQELLANVVNRGIVGGCSVTDGEMACYINAMVGMLNNDEAADRSWSSMVKSLMAQGNQALALLVEENEFLAQSAAHFVYDPGQITPDTVVRLADQFIHVVSYVDCHGLDIPLADILTDLSTFSVTPPLPRQQTFPDLERVHKISTLGSQLDKVDVSTEKNPVNVAGQRSDHHFYHLVVLRFSEPVGWIKLEHVIQELVLQFPALGTGSTQEMLRRVVIDDVTLCEPDTLHQCLHDAHDVECVHRSLFSVVGLIPNNADRTKWISVYAHYDLGDQIQFHQWVARIQDLVTNSSTPPSPVAEVVSDGSRNPTDYWETHFGDHLADLGLFLDNPHTTSPTYHARRYHPAVPSSLVSQLAPLMDTLAVNRLELLQGLFAIFLLRITRQSHVALLGQTQHKPWVPWTAQRADKASIQDMLRALVKEYRLSAQYDWSRFVIPQGSVRPAIRVAMLLKSLGWSHDFSQPHATVPLSLTWLYREDSDSLELVVDFNTDMFQLVTIERLLCNFLYFATQCSANMIQEWHKVPVIHPDERTLVLDTFAHSDFRQATNGTVPTNVLTLFSNQVKLHPDITAVECGNHQETYRSIYSKVQQLATHLHSLGIQQQDHVAVIVESNVYTTMTILTLWALGAVYVPIDYQLPQERQQYMMETADCTWVLSTSTTKTTNWTNVVDIQDLLSTISTSEVHSTVPLVSGQGSQPSDLAYIVFTSGTTGKPKGVTVTHGNFGNLVTHHHLFTGFSPVGTRVLLSAGAAFDGYLYSMLLSLSSGWSLVLSTVPLEVLDKVDVMMSTPTFLASVDPSICPQLSWILVGGEQLSGDLVARWTPQCTLFNVYGPTETTVLSHLHKVDPSARRVTIGRPYPNYECYVLDELMQPVPIGVVGELFIGGAGVSPGYMKRPDLNEHRFLPNPFGPGKLYRTGDYGRWLPNGEMECLGRIDDQIKLRGFRIELGEIRGALLKQSGVRDAFVMVVDKKFIVGFIVGEPGISLSDRDLQEALKSILPRYMVPSHLVILQGQSGFPLTLNGKIDQPKLQAIFREQRTTKLGKRSHIFSLDALGECQRVLVTAVLSALQLTIDEICFSSSLLRLGGDSINAVQVSVQCRQKGWHVSVSSLLQEQSLESVAQTMSKVESNTDVAINGLASSPPSLPKWCLSPDELATVHRELATWGWKSEDIQSVYPMLPMQQGMMAATSQDPTEYVVQLQVTLHGSLSTNDIAQMLWLLVQSYDAMRVNFLTNWSQGTTNGLQIIRLPRYKEFLERQWCPLELGVDRDSYAHDEVKRGFGELSPTIRFAVQDMGTDCHWLLITAHHAVVDGWSVGLLLRSLLQKLSLKLGCTSEDTPSPPSFGDYSLHVQSQSSHPTKTSKAYWQEYLANIDATTIVSLPNNPNGLDKVQEAESVLHGNTGELRGILKHHAITIHTLIQTAWALTLNRYTGGQMDLIFGQVFSGRGGTNYPNIDELVGCLVNTLPVRIQLTQEQSVMSLLQYVQGQHHGMLQHQHSHLTDINQWIGQSNVRVGDLFNSLLVYQNFPPLSSKDSILKVLDATFIRSSQFALTPMVEHCGDQLLVRISHRPQEFHTQYVRLMSQYMASCFQFLVRNLAENDGRVPALSLSGEVSVQDPETYFPPRTIAAPTYAIDTTLCVHHILQQEAQSIGDRAAIEYKDGIQWTYAELYQRSLKIVHGLLDSGVNREEPVGLVIDRLPSAIAAMFGILMAGAAYVPMNADFPKERIRFIVQDCGIRTVLTNAGVELVGVQILDIDTLMDQPTTEPHLPQVKPTDLSHIIYTSGTTGNPKGVQQEHRTVANYVQQPEEVLGIVPGLRMMQSMSLASDCSTIEVFGGLCNGVTLVLRTDMLDTLAKVDTVMLTPSVLATIDPSHYPNITRVLVGGEALPLHTAERWANHCRLFNVYGPSECFATHSTEFRVGDPVTIGRVIANIESYILDDQLRPVPFGVPGEICLGGIGLTRGYVNRLELNRTKFVGNPCSPDGSRLYRSGDLGRWLLNGTVEYFARKDDQVKIRGYRVEPQEVEAALLECPGVVSAAVLPHDGKLYGFCSPEDVDIYKVKECLNQTLPPYMVPQSVFSMDSIPLTVVGKIDKHSLKSTLEQRLANTDERVVKGPNNPTEQVIHRAMGETLNIPLDHLDARDSFFQLGGDSILAIRFSSLCRERGIRMSIAQIFQYKTVTALGQLVKDAVEIGDPLPTLAPWELTLLDYGSKCVPTESVTLAVAEEKLSTLASTLSSIVQSCSVFNSRYDPLGRQLIYQPHPSVAIEKNVEASVRLDASQGVWLRGIYTSGCDGLNLVTLVAHRFPLNRVGGWSGILQGVAKQCPELGVTLNPATVDRLSTLLVPKGEAGSSHQLVIPYCDNPFSNSLVHNGLHTPLSVIAMMGFLLALRQLGGFDPVSIVGSGCCASYDSKCFDKKPPVDVLTELQRAKEWYHSHLIHDDSPGIPKASILYHYNDASQSHGVPLIEQYISFWNKAADLQAAVNFRPNFLVLRLFHRDVDKAESLLVAWKNQVKILLDLPNQLRDTDHCFIPADFPHLALTSGDLNELVADVQRDLGIPPAAIHDMYPLSTMQKNFVVNTLRDPTSYIVQHVFRIAGELDLTKYRAVWDKLGNRHTILRTKFLASHMVQVVKDQADIDWMISEGPLTTSVEEYQQTVRQLGFDLSGGNPLLRIHLFPDINGQGWLCFLAVHHAVIDGWSYQQLMNESLALYHGERLQGEVPYLRFIESVSNHDSAADKRYWTDAFKGLQPTPDLPFPHLFQEDLYRKDTVVLNRTAPLHQLCRTWGITFNVLLRGIWALMLNQYLGKPDEVTFGVMVSGRDGQVDGLDRLVGPTINTLPFRAKVVPQQPVAAWLQGLAEQSTQLLEHEQTSLVDIKHWAGVDTNAQLFHSVMTFGRYLESGASSEKSLIEYHSLTGYNDTEYPLMASFDEPVPGGALHLTIMASHEPLYMDGLVDCISHLLSRLDSADPDALSVGTLLHPSPTALAQVQAWIPGPTVIPSNPNVLTVLDLFTQTLVHQPHRVALETMYGRYTYHECYTQACTIGRALLNYGLRPGTNVALLFTQSAHYFMAVLATWLVGGVAVPMDATNAPTRLQSMVNSLGEGAFLVTRIADDSDQVTLPDFYAAKIITDDLESLRDTTLDLPSCRQDPTALALIIHTSGTTGVPKGVMLRHESIINYISYITQFVSLPTTCRFLQAVNIAFDGYFMITLSMWAVGGTLVLQDGELVDDMKRVTHCGLTPSMLGVLNPEDYPQIEAVFSGGEALSYSVTNNWLAAGKRVVNVYGPSEITIASHVGLIAPHELISIGRPISNTTCYILDDECKMVPPGVPGQICIGGIGVSNGYWKQPDLTSKAFIDNPFGPGKIYLTGDLGCWLPNGKVYYNGRKDHQVKLRGFRIELGEVESWCERLDLNIQQAVALVVNKQLVTYVSPKSVDANEVMQELKQALPHYMVPAYVIPLDDMPKTRNGKVDRRTLAKYPMPQVTNSIGFEDETSNVSDTYRLVCSLVQQALQLDESHPLPTPNTSFFSMGGDSISAVRFSTLCRKQGLNVTVASIFKLQTIGAIVALCETQAGARASPMISSSSRFQRWLTDEQRGTVDMMVEVQDPDQSVGILRKPLGFTNSNQWRTILAAGHPLNLQRSTDLDPSDIADVNLTTKWFIAPSIFPMFSTDGLYGHYQCTLSEALLAGFLAAWGNTRSENIQADLFRMTDNELVGTTWPQDSIFYHSQSPLTWLQHVKKMAREATWPNDAGAETNYFNVLFHMVDPVVGVNVTRQRQQPLVPILGSRRRYDLEVMAWYQRDGTVTLAIYDEIPGLSKYDADLCRALLAQWTHEMEKLIKCSKGLAWLPSDFPLVPFDNVHGLPVDPTQVQTVWPLSSLQRGFVVESLKDPSAYAIQLVFELRGVLDIDRYHQAWLTVGQRHDSLRVRFYPEEMVQVVLRNFNLEWSYETKDLSEVDIPDYLQRMRQRGFTDLSNAPLLRIQLLKQDETRHLCFFTIHHAVLDAWSIDVVLEEVQQLYNGRTLTSTPVSYGGFLEHTTKISPTQSQSFWEAYLQGVEPSPDLPLPKPDNSPVDSTTEPLKISLASMQAWCGKLGITINSLVRGLWALLLGRYLGQDAHEVTFGVMVTGRDGDIEGVDEMVGPTVNTLPFRVKLDRTQPIHTWLQAIHSQSGTLMDHGHVGLLDIETWTNQKPLFQSMLINTKSRSQGVNSTLENTHDKLQWVAKGGYNQMNFPLTLGFSEQFETDRLMLQLTGAHGSAYYSSMVAYINAVLETLVDEIEPRDPLTLGGLLDCIPPPEMKLIRAWSQGSHASYKGRPCLVHELITLGKSEIQLDNVALESLGHSITLTYRELIDKSQAVAQRLLALDSPNRFVILFFQRGPAFIISMLGTLMAGKAAVPMDASHASERLTGMCQTLGERNPVVLTFQENYKASQVLFDGCTLCIDDLLTQKVSIEPLDGWKSPQVDPTDTAIVFFTSGSTGKPKAVPQRHESIVNCILGMSDMLAIPSSCRFLQALNIGFDSSIFEVFIPLCVGGTLVLQGDELVHCLGKVDSCMLTPSMLHAVGDPSNYPNLQMVATIGEPLPQALAERWCQAQGGRLRLFNTYGPTEAVVATHFERVNLASDNSLVTIGRTIPNVQCHILDNTLSVVPIGVVGEICLSGICVCHGYLNDEKRSREVFVPNPFGPGLLYHTGDLGCWLTDGRLLCMGRKDNQVKLRGFRIELSEVESAVYQVNHHVQQAVALVKQGQLAVYFTSTDRNSVSIAELRERLSRSLPPFMVPDHLIQITEIPHTSNGKVDRKQLIALELTETDDNASHLKFDFSPTERAMFTHLQNLVADIISLPDGHRPIQPGSSFFQLGGDSITAIQLSGRSKRELGLNLDVQDIFHHQGVLGALIKHVGQPSDANMISVDTNVNTTRYPCTPLQAGMISAITKDPAAYIMQVRFTAGIGLDMTQFQKAWILVVENNPTLRTRFEYDDCNEQWMQVIMDHVKLGWQPFTDAETYLAQDCQRGFTVDGPFIRFGYHPDKHECVLTMHHSITDGWSLGLIFDQVVDIYHRLTHQQAVPSGVADGYAQFAHYVTNQSVDAAREFWQHELQGVTEGTLLCGASANPTAVAKSEGSVRHVMDDIGELSHYIQEHGITLSTLLRVVWALVLRRYTGKERDVLFGVVVSGRNLPLPNMDRIVGLCINTLPCRVTLEKHQTVESLIETVHQGSIRTHGYDCYPLSDVQQWSGFPVNQDMFNTLLVVENLPFHSGGDLDLQLDSVFNPTEYPLSVVVFPAQDQLEIAMNYHTSKFTDMFVQQMLDDFVYTLRSLLVDPSKSLVDVLARHSELDSMTPTPVDYSLRYAHYFMEQQIQRTPGHTALYDLSTNQGFTYRQVDKMSHYVAWMLLNAVEAGCIKSDQVVGIVARNSLGLFVAQLAIWKLGLAFVVVDPEYPMDRIQCIASDTRCIAWVGYGYEVPFSILSASPWISLDGLADSLLTTHPLPHLPEVSIDPRDLAYVVYTSGSTGQPKGVLVEHGSFANYLYGYQSSVINATSETKSPTLLASTFDAAIGESWTPLSFGGTILLTQEKTDFERAMRMATQVATTPSLLSNFNPDEFRHLQRVVLGGEPAESSLIRKWQQGGVSRVVNVYGPCESTVASHFKIFIKDCLAKDVSIGQPLPGYKGVILDSWMTLTPVGVMGELWIGGRSVARGYLRREELTRERFVDTLKWGRLYRTGDLARWLPNGDVEILGRVDNQVKVRGFRVELEEVERAIIASETDISRVCVAYDPDKKILVGFVTPEDVKVDQVLDTLQERLPHYMVPNTIVPVEDFPLSHNDKTDRKALLALPRRNNIAEDSHDFTPMETKLVNLLAEVLRMNPASVSPRKDTFFTLGGNSISAMHFVSRCKNCGIYLDLVDINRQTNIATLAKRACEGTGKPAPDMQLPKYDHGPFPLTPVQRLYFRLDLVDQHQWPLPLLMKFSTPRALNEWHSVVTALVSHHAMMRARFSYADGEWRGRVLPIDEDPVQITEVTLTDETEYWSVMAEANRMMNFTTGPIYLAFVMNYLDVQYFYLPLHHLIADNMSVNLIAEDICTLLNGQALPYKTMPYTAWSQNLVDLAQTVHLDSHEVPNEDELVLPPSDIDQAKCDEVGQRNQALSSQLDASTTLTLDNFGHLDTTAEDIIMTGLLLAYTNVFGCSSIPLQYTSHGRNALGNPWDVSRTVGFFINSCPMILRRSDPGDMQSTLDGVKTNLRGVSDFAVKYMLAGHSIKSPIGYNFLGKSNASYSPGVNGMEILNLVASDEFQQQRVNQELMPLVFFVQYVEDCLSLAVSYEPSRYSAACMAKVLDEWHQNVQHLVEQLNALD